MRQGEFKLRQTEGWNNNLTSEQKAVIKDLIKQGTSSKIIKTLFSVGYKQQKVIKNEK